MTNAESPLIEAAVALGASYNQVLRLVLVGDLKGVRRGGRWFVDRGDLARLCSERLTNLATQGEC